MKLFHDNRQTIHAVGCGIYWVFVVANDEHDMPGSSRDRPPQLGSHWSEQARRWQHIGALLRPGREDLEYLQGALARHFDPETPRRALLCGVTPELAALPLPTPMELLAVDQSAAMLAAVWPGDTAQRRALVGDWFALDRLQLDERSVGLAMGDGCLTLLDYPAGYRRLGASLARVLAPRGLWSLRLFCRPEQAESLEALVAALDNGQIGSFHALKWRLAMALQGADPARGVHLDRVWRTFCEHFASPEALAERAGFPLHEVQTIENYRGAASHYSYSTVEEAVGELGNSFELLETWRGSYELAERCPTLLFRRR